jgi:hypothetical protein
LRLIVKQSSNDGDIEGGDDFVNPLKEGLDLDSGPFMKCRIPGLDYVVFVWGSGPHRVDYGNVAPKEVIVSRKCAEAVLRGAQVGFDLGFYFVIFVIDLFLIMLIFDCLCRCMFLVYWLVVLMWRKEIQLPSLLL